MKNFKFTGLLTLALGLALIIGNSAFTSTQFATKYYTPNGVGGYNEVTSIVQTESYQCNESVNECIVQFSNDDPQSGMKTVLNRGDFQQLP